MSEVTLERVLEEVKQLTDEEQQQLRILLDRNLSVSQDDTRAQQQMLLDRLLAKGIIGSIPSRLYQEQAGDLHAPIEVNGKPVSETLLDDRE